MQDEIEQEGVAEVEPNVAEPRVYELAFHMDPELPQEEAKKAYQSIKDLISANGTFVTEGEPEKIQLAYTIERMETTGRRDFNSAYFAWIAYEAVAAGHAAIQEVMRGDTRIVRFLDLLTTREAAQHAAEMQEFYRQAAAEAARGDVGEGEANDTELDAALKEAGVS